ncbi:MAG: ImmA/IrrE family metallo-endopeptidase [Thermales bacterium]|nr:ImmA/IrrE family metallo-endopeptidase [Thermales bacterium]
MYRNDNISQNEDTKEMEKEANQIAATILMRDEIVQDFINHFCPVEDISKSLGVSIEAITYKINNLGYTVL